MLNPWRRVLVETMRWYVRSGSVRRGRDRLVSWGCGLLPDAPEVARSLDGRKFTLEFPRDRGWEYLYFAGTFEAGTTNVVRRLLRPDDVTFDVGANIVSEEPSDGKALPIGQFDGRHRPTRRNGSSGSPT